MNQKPILVGLCGRSGSGKGYVSALFAETGIPAIDTDLVYRELTGSGEMPSPCMAELIRAFGDAIRNDDNSLNRAVLRTMVFGEDNKQNLLLLNQITHRHILKASMERAEALYSCGYAVVLIDAPVLYESGFDRFCDAVVCVTAPEEEILRRIMKRDGIDRSAAEARLGSQISAKVLADRADYVIANDTDKDTLRKRVRDVSEKLFSIKNGEK